MTDLSVLIVDDEASVRRALAQTMDLAEIAADHAGDPRAALKIVARSIGRDPHQPQIGAIVTDIVMPGIDGFALLAAVQEMDADLPVILLTGNGDVPMAVRAMSAGAYDFQEKPASPARMVEIVRRALDKRHLVLENRALKQRISAGSGNGTRMILGDAPASRQFRETLRAIAYADADVLIEGETGVGKEDAALELHRLSDRRRGPFITVHCGALPPDIAIVELFGREAGATPDARARVGKFEAAEDGIIFLDEIETMPPDIQIRILRVIQAREIDRLGGTRAVPLNIRIVAATKADLRAEVAAQRFRSDLFHRLDVARLKIPPLRERLDDMQLLFTAFVARSSDRVRRAPPEITADILSRLTTHDWPGNVRELKNVAERFAQGLGLEIGGAQQPEGPQGRLPLTERVDTFERQVIADALSQTGGKVSEAALLLGLPRKTLYDKLTRHGLSGTDYR
jgi:two-component system C4-dicarboxylate transport response regulator DctD